ncbi:hypothetical protein [Lactiplantibacillus paraxiangfangensis]|uniref:hypothetical protein n=1 Tax=Lactiplantibacillus paraxiangfangensis TaxID=3076224 RepID=UPI0030C67334
MKVVIIPGFGIVAAFGLSGTNCLLAHVSTIAIGKANQKFSDWLFESCPRLVVFEINLNF